MKEPRFVSRLWASVVVVAGQAVTSAHNVDNNKGGRSSTRETEAPLKIPA
jgi:hypothetical protein